MYNSDALAALGRLQQQQHPPLPASLSSSSDLSLESAAVRMYTAMQYSASNNVDEQEEDADLDNDDDVDDDLDAENMAFARHREVLQGSQPVPPEEAAAVSSAQRITIAHRSTKTTDAYLPKIDEILVSI
jgi:uncharacterized protein involved in copper resistance